MAELAHEIDLAPRPRGRPATLTAEQRKQRHAQYMKQYYETHKETMNASSKRAYMRRRPQPAPQLPDQAPQVPDQAPDQ